MNLCRKFRKSKEEIYRALTAKKNRAMERRWAETPFSERIVLVPHCLRNSEKCVAKEMGSYYLCAECGACPISAISKKSKELQYKGVFILKGGRTIEKLINEFKPRAMLGVACYFEGAQGMEYSERSGITVQFVPLTKDGCVNTDVPPEEVIAKMTLK